MALFSFFGRSKKQRKDFGIKPLPFPNVKNMKWDVGVISRTIDVLRQRFAALEDTNYAIAHTHLRHRDMFDARRCFRQVIKRNAAREDAHYYLAVSRLLSGGKHADTGAEALRQPAANGFASFAEDAEYMLNIFADHSFVPHYAPFLRMSEQEQLFRVYREESRTFLRKFVPEAPSLDSAEQAGGAPRDTVGNETALLYHSQAAEDDATLFLINVMMEYAPPERTSKVLLLGDTGAGYDYLERKDMTPDIARAVLPSPLPALIGTPAAEARQPKGTVIRALDDIPAPEQGFDVVVCSGLCRYFMHPGHLFHYMGAALAPRALIVFAVPLAEDDSQDPLFLPGVDMFVTGEHMVQEMMKNEGFEYIKTRRFTRHERDMKRLLCVYRMPLQEEERDQTE